jgi:hypothetical protein
MALVAAAVVEAEELAVAVVEVVAEVVVAAVAVMKVVEVAVVSAVLPQGRLVPMRLVVPTQISTLASLQAILLVLPHRTVTSHLPGTALLPPAPPKRGHVWTQTAAHCRATL